MGNNRRSYIDSIKGFTILVIAVMHIGLPGLPPVIAKLVDFGDYGVQMFFILSGYLNMCSAARHFKGSNNVSFKNSFDWIGKRFKRLLPLYYLAMAGALAIRSPMPYWLGTEGRVNEANISAHVLCVNGFFPHYNNSILNVEWYLAALFIYICLTPLIYKYLSKILHALGVIVVLLLLNPILYGPFADLFPVANDPDIYLSYVYYFSPYPQLVIYMFGVLLFFIIGRIQKIKVDHPAARSYILLSIGGLLCVIQIYMHWSFTFVKSFQLMAVFFLLIVISQEIHPSPVIDNKFFAVVGRHSYGIYLFQFVWLKLFDRIYKYKGTGHGAIRLVTSLVALFIISYVVTKAERFARKRFRLLMAR